MYESPQDYDKSVRPRIDKTLGYLYFMDREHPLADKKGRVWHHRHVASVKLGRWLRPNEVAHHDDEDRSNNESSNLIAKSKAEHAHDHFAGEPIPERSCMGCGRPFRGHSAQQAYCRRECSPQFQPVAAWPSDSDLQSIVWHRPVTELARELGVTSSAVKAHCRRRGISTPPRGWWTGK